MTAAWTLVTGGAKGLGAEICRQLAAEGRSIVVHYRNSAEEARRLCNECEALGGHAEALQGDFSDPNTVDDFIRRYKQRYEKTSCLINNASVYQVAPLSQTSICEWLKIYQTNLNAPFQITKSLLPALLQAKGCIVSIGVCGLDTRRADTYSAAYTMTKQGLYQMTRSLAKELAPQGVRVNMVSPGMLELSQDSLPALPMSRAATFKETAEAVLFLLSESNSYITGQNLEVAGGLSL